MYILLLVVKEYNRGGTGLSSTVAFDYITSCVHGFSSVVHTKRSLSTLPAGGTIE